uniref:Uncharacterized protein n=1 Tax=Lepeophtheirus salmonis TaxID=72036 RepID=A0A0K2VBM0_LEPSM
MLEVTFPVRSSIVHRNSYYIIPNIQKLSVYLYVQIV